MFQRSTAFMLAAATAALAFLPAPGRAGAWLPGHGEFYTEIRGRLFSSDSYRNVDGERVPLGGVYEQRDLISYSEFGWWKRGTFVLGLPATSVTLRDESGAFEDTETGLADMVVGIRVGLLEGENVLSVEADWKAPLLYDEDLTPSLGDGQEDWTGLLLFGRSIPQVNGFVDLAGGYRYRTQEPADQIVMRADAGFWVGSSLLLTGRYSGAIASGDGETPQDAETVHRVGPEIRWRVDDFLDVFAGSMHSASGENVLHADEFFVGIAARKTSLNRLQGYLGGTRRP
jgi:hypothetical protein